MKKILKIAFYGIGTFLLVFSSIVVGANFFKDSGVFDKPVVEVRKQPQATKKPIKISINEEKEPAKPTEEKNTPQPTPSNEKITVEVINYTDKKGLAEDVRTMLEAKGFQVSAGNKLETKQDTSKIIERKKGISKKGKQISNMLNIPVINQDIEGNSRFDITIILGTDFNP